MSLDDDQYMPSMKKFVFTLQNSWIASRVNWKRMIDVTIILALLPLILAVCLSLFVLIFLTSGRPVFFQQLRMGRLGKPFKIYKFRTMTVEQDALYRLFAENLDLHQEYHRYRKLKNDPRVTPLGRILRMFSLDELPQFVNILRGEMSLVGPRPYTLDEIDPETTQGKIILSVLPGVTGWWQVNGRNETTFEERKQLDCYYVKHRSLRLDLNIVLMSPRVILRGTGR